jgi:phosphoribosylformylglycinamidine synthase I
VKSAVVIFPGSNRDRDMIKALSLITGTDPVAVWHTQTTLPETDLIVLPGGFSYGDYLRAGAIAARSPIMVDLVRKASSGVPVLGVCNGFQTLAEAGLLPGALMRNAGLKFVCRQVHLRVDNANTLFTGAYAPGQVIQCPVAHHDGNYFADSATLDRLEDADRIAFRYCNTNGGLSEDANPNGSQRHIAGILNDAGNVLGMMPHPENLVEPLHGGSDGRALFEGILARLH